MAGVDRLTTAYDQALNVLWSFARGTEFDEPLARPTATQALPWADYGYNPLGTRPAAIAQTALAWTFVYRYDGGAAYTNWSALQKALTLAFGHGRTIILEKTDGDGVTMQCDAICTQVPRRADLDTTLFAKFTLTFEQRGPWRGPYPIGASVYDAGLLFDNSVLFDALTSLTFTTTGATNTFNLTNAGNATITDIVIEFTVPASAALTGPFSLINLSLDVRGTPVTGANANPMYLLVADSLAPGEFYRVTTRTGAVETNRPTGGWQNVGRAPGQVPYFAVGPGTNSCALNVAGSTFGGQVSFTMRDSWN